MKNQGFNFKVQGLMLVVCLLMASCTFPPIVHLADGTTITGGSASVGSKSLNETTTVDVQTPGGASVKISHTTTGKDETAVPTGMIRLKGLGIVTGAAGEVMSDGIQELGN